MELGQNVNNRRQHTVGSALCKSPFLCHILSPVFHQCHQLRYLGGWKSLSTCQYQNIPSSSTVHSVLGYSMQSFTENKPKGTFAREYCFQTSLWRLFINYKHKHVKFPQGLLLDHPSLDTYLWTFFPLAFISCLIAYLLSPFTLFLPDLQIILSILHLFCLDINFLHFHLSDTLYLAAGPFVTMTTRSWCQQRVSLLSEEVDVIKCQGCCLSWCLVSCTQGRSFVRSLLYFVCEPGKAIFLC